MWRWLREEWLLARRSARIAFVSIVVLALLGAAAGVYLLRSWQYQPEVLPVDAETVDRQRDLLAAETRREDLSGAALQQALLKRYLAMLGRPEKLASLRSIRATGTLEFSSGLKRRVVLVKMHGGYLRVTVGAPPEQIIMGLTPEDAWQLVLRAGREVVEDLDPLQLGNLRRSAYPVSKLYLAMQNEWSIAYRGEESFEGQTAHVFEVGMEDGHSMRFFIDAESFLEIGAEERYPGESGEIVTTRHIQSEHFQADGLMMPGRVETHINGAFSHVFTVESAEVNPGVLESSFARPATEPNAES